LGVRCLGSGISRKIKNQNAKSKDTKQKLKMDSVSRDYDIRGQAGWGETGVDNSEVVRYNGGEQFGREL
jgi:hypothetical protein